jgi:gluconolactonase
MRANTAYTRRITMALVVQNVRPHVVRIMTQALGRRHLLTWRIPMFLLAPMLILVVLCSTDLVGQETARVPDIPGVVVGGAQIDLVKEGFVFTEGPIGTSDGGLFFSDVRATPSKVYRLDSLGQVTLFRDNANASNGLAFDRAGNLLAAERDGKRIVRLDSRGVVVSILTEGSASQSFLAPNDLIVDAKGGIYFTDPGLRPLVPGRKAHVWYLPPGAKQAVVVSDEILRPNGLTLTRDGKTLIVADTVGDIVFAFDVQPDGTTKNRRPFARVRDVPAGQESGADGMALDGEDRVYVTSSTGVQVFDRTGQYLGTVPLPRKPANLAFSGPDKRTLYITAGEGLYRLRMLARGPDRLGK